MTLNSGATRRRGRELEEAILEAAWAELVERGYEEFTIDAAAARASTSRAVLYRRWPGKQELVHAAIVHELGKGVIAAPDTGSLRGDVLALLRRANQLRVHRAAVLMSQIGGFYRATGTSLSDLDIFVSGGRSAIMGDVIDRAVARGEIRRGQVSDRVARLPVDLFRHEMLMTLKPIPDQAIEEIVDTIFLPLVRQGDAAGGASR